MDTILSINYNRFVGFAQCSPPPLWQGSSRHYHSAFSSGLFYTYGTIITQLLIVCYEYLNNFHGYEIKQKYVMHVLLLII